MATLDTPELAELRKVFKGDIILPGDDEYQSAIKRWSRLSERPAGMVLFVKDEQDVALAIKYAVKHGISVVVKCGGHSPAGASSTDGGMVIDLSRHLTAVNPDPVAKVVRIGGGALGGNVDKAAEKVGMATVGGTVSHTGVAGLLLGGGFGRLTGLHGMGADNILGVTLVTANGQILQADKDENSDLFWAIRGAGVNFGVVTEFRCQLHPIPPKETQTPSDSALLLIVTGPAPDDQTVMVVCTHIGNAEAGRKQYRCFFDIGPLEDLTSETSYSKLNETLNYLNTPGRAYYMGAARVESPSEQNCLEMLRCQRDVSAKLPGNVQTVIQQELHHMTKADSVPANAMAYAQRTNPKKDQVSCTISWDREDIPLELVKSLHGQLVRNVEGFGEDDGGQAYANYKAEVLDPDVVRKTFGINYPSLQMLKAKYDPNVVFNKWLPIEPAQ